MPPEGSQGTRAADGPSGPQTARRPPLRLTGGTREGAGPGLRQGPGNRQAWEHPQDLVNLLAELKGIARPPLEALGPNRLDAFFERLTDIAWLHDIIEDGRKGDGSKVTKDDLYHEGIHEDVITAVLHLTHREDEEKIVYLARLRDRAAGGGIGPDVIIVKLVDRICNLREGKNVFKDHRWARVIKETNEYILPMADALPLSEQIWLRDNLLAAIQARPVVVV